MPRFRFDKLVRDNIVESIIKSGGKVKYRVLDKDKLKTELINKIVEEAKEIATAIDDDLASEIADAQQAIDDLTRVYGLTPKNIKDAQNSKNNKAGAFKKAHFIEYVEVDDNNAWVEYYRKNPDRYPEF